MWTQYITVLWPEFLLVAAACVLFLLGTVATPAARRLVPVISLIALGVVFLVNLFQHVDTQFGDRDPTNVILVNNFAIYIKMLAAGMGMLFVLLSWPTSPDSTRNSALDVGQDVGEFFALMLLAITGILLVASAQDIILLFLGIELASIPTYIMVSISRPLPVAQEAGVKYFFLGAMSAALMLFGFSYLYGTTGYTDLGQISSVLHSAAGTSSLNTWQLLAFVMLLSGFAFKIAAVPLHAYAGDVYQGAATPVTALLAFVPKTSGFVALIKILNVIAGPDWIAPDVVIKLLWIIAVLTMSFGNVLGLLQFNVKRVLAYSSVAHSGYMLVGLTALLAAKGLPNAPEIQKTALAGVLFYLAAYGVMNTGAFGVLMMLPGRTDAPGRHGPDGTPFSTAESAETFEDLAGQGNRHLLLGLAMAVCCLSLTGIPLTVGFFGKVLLIKPAWAVASAGTGSLFTSRMFWLVVITMINAAVSAAYYLKIISTMFLRTDSTEAAQAAGIVPAPAGVFRSAPVGLAVALSAAGTLFFGVFLPGTNALTTRVQEAVGGRQATSPQAPAIHRASLRAASDGSRMADGR
ncbi:MAG: nuoN [Phycisphaerales bacterium]|nr:nuoN [Phycisphaerales bacterium]